jgi:hypothetical protein
MGAPLSCTRSQIQLGSRPPTFLEPRAQYYLPSIDRGGLWRSFPASRIAHPRSARMVDHLGPVTRTLALSLGGPGSARFRAPNASAGFRRDQVGSCPAILGPSRPVSAAKWTSVRARCPVREHVDGILERLQFP